ncbi:hypothetical protein [Streptomyces kanamyceticus]|uniref:hypothetical protein n=1 Tax=Streptomyces kanamyceticus TaxID=1967 RepID=UPI0037DDD78D
MTHTWRRRLTAAGAVAAAVAVTLTSAEPAAAAMPFGSVDPGIVSQFKLNQVVVPGGAGGTDAAVDAVEKTGAVKNVDVSTVLNTGGSTGIAGLCHDTGLSASLKPGGYCWKPQDDRSSSWNVTDGGWTPQGLSLPYSDSGPAADGQWKGVSAYAATWHHGTDMGNPDPAKRRGDEYARLSLVSTKSGTPNYHNLLLVQPAVNADGTGDLRVVPGNHVDGVVWYGDRAFVANGRYLQVYDLRHIWKLNKQDKEVGITGTTSSGLWHNYAVPMVAMYRTTTGSAACTVTAGTTPCLNSLSLDRTGGQDALVSAEYKKDAAGGRVVRWPLDATTKLPKGHASAAYSSPVWSMQGAATDGTNWYMSGTCPTGAGGGTAEDPYSCIHKAQANTAPHVMTAAPVYTQNLGYSWSTDRLWGINERINSTAGRRVVFSVNTP